MSCPIHVSAAYMQMGWPYMYRMPVKYGSSHTDIAGKACFGHIMYMSACTSIGISNHKQRSNQKKFPISDGMIYKHAWSKSTAPCVDKSYTNLRLY